MSVLVAIGLGLGIAVGFYLAVLLLRIVYFYLRDNVLPSRSASS